MNTIVFLMKETPKLYTKISFATYMLRHGCKVKFEKALFKKKEPNEALIVTDRTEIFKECSQLSIECLAAITEEKEMDDFPGARFFVMEPFDTEAEYYKRIYNRVNHIPLMIAKTSRLLLRETTEEDVEEFAKIYGDPDITKYTDGILDIYTEKKYVNVFREKEYELRGFGIWTVIRKKDNRVIGRCGFDVRAAFDEPEVGYVIGKEFQSKGYATEALKAALSFARKKKLGKINAFVMSGNDASKRVLEKCGFSFVGSKEINQKSYEQWQTKN